MPAGDGIHRVTSGRLSARRLLVDLAVVPGCALALLFLVTGRKPTPAFFSLLGLAAPAALPSSGGTTNACFGGSQGSLASWTSLPSP